MNATVTKHVGALEDMTVAELRERYAEVFGEPTASRHKQFLCKRIAWGLQAAEEGGLSERALKRAKELARDSDLTLLAPAARTVTRPFKPSHDRRLPMPGAVITREYRGQMVAVTVLDIGFEFQGTVYRSLSAIAKVITGSHWNGPLFFGLTGKRGKP